MKLFAPGSIPWLLVHEVRIAFRGIGGKGGKAARSRRIRLLIAALLVAGATGFGGWKLADFIAGRPVPELPLLYLGLEAAMAFLFTLILAQSLNLATQAFYERNDLDLLLSSPLPPARVLTVRALGIAVMGMLLYLVLASMLVIPLALHGDFRGLAVYLVLADLALLATAAGLVLAMALFRALGARRTRVVSQVLAAVIGASAFLLGQARNFLPRDEWNRMIGQASRLGGKGYDPHAFYAWPARAILGDPLPLLTLTVLATAAFYVVTTSVGRRFASDAAAAAGVSSTGDAQGKRRAVEADKLSFAGGALRSLARKDARLLIRDPWLISQILLQMIYILPLVFVMWRNAHSNLLLAAGGPLVFLTGQLAGNLTWVVVSAEDAPELIVSAPVGGWRILQAKLLVAVGPVALLSLIPLAIFWVVSPLGGLIVSTCCVAGWISAALINIWYAKPADRKQMMRRRSGAGLMGLAEVLLLFAWAGTAYLFVAGLFPWALIPPILAIAVLVVVRRPTAYRPALA